MDTERPFAPGDFYEPLSFRQRVAYTLLSDAGVTTSELAETGILPSPNALVPFVDRHLAISPTDIAGLLLLHLPGSHLLDLSPSDIETMVPSRFFDTFQELKEAVITHHIGIGVGFPPARMFLDEHASALFALSQDILPHVTTVLTADGVEDTSVDVDDVVRTYGSTASMPHFRTFPGSTGLVWCIPYRQIAAPAGPYAPREEDDRIAGYFAVNGHSENAAISQMAYDSGALRFYVGAYVSDVFRNRLDLIRETLAEAGERLMDRNYDGVLRLAVGCMQRYSSDVGGKPFSIAVWDGKGQAKHLYTIEAQTGGNLRVSWTMAMANGGSESVFVWISRNVKTGSFHLRVPDRFSRGMMGTLLVSREGYRVLRSFRPPLFAGTLRMQEPPTLTEQKKARLAASLSLEDLAREINAMTGGETRVEILPQPGETMVEMVNDVPPETLPASGTLFGVN